MGNVCFGGGGGNVTRHASSSPSSQTGTAIGTATPSGTLEGTGQLAGLHSRASTSSTAHAPRVSIGGKMYTSVDTLPDAAREVFLREHDPVRNLRLTDDSVLYRVTEKKWIKNGALSGNPESHAMIANHNVVRENSYHTMMAGYSGYGNIPTHMPVDMKAHNLGTPVVNVMYGSQALRQIAGYAKRGDRELVSMTLGDFRRAGGGDVYFDVSAAMNAPNAQALIVTLPKRAHVPVSVLPPPVQSTE